MTLSLSEARAIVVAGLGFGDEGKGATVDWLARQTGARLVVRYNGGCQAGHRVVLADGREHIFSQFGSTSFLPGARTFLSRFVMVDPMALVAEAAALDMAICRNGVPAGHWVAKIGADWRCLMVTPWHRAANRLRELGRGANRHGSCGRGVGEAVRVSVERPDLAVRLGRPTCTAPGFRAHRMDLRELSGPLDDLRKHLAGGVSQWFSLAPEEARVLQDPASVHLFQTMLQQFYACCGLYDSLRDFREGDEKLIFEGAQGVLLDETLGIGAPDHATWSRCTFENAKALCLGLGLNLRSDVYYLGVIRTYMTRHGAGPLPGEIGDPRPIAHEHNSSDEPWQGKFRVGLHQRSVLEVSAQAIGRMDGIALTHCDRWPKWAARATGLKEVYGAPVVLISHGPTAEDRSEIDAAGVLDQRPEWFGKALPSDGNAIAVP